MTEHQGEASGIRHCTLCSGDYPADFVESITSASATIGARVRAAAFRKWLMEEMRDPDC